MPIFKSPFSPRVHKFMEYDDDYILNNSITKEKSDIQFNNEAITKKGWNLNKESSRKKVYNDVVLDKEYISNKARQNRRKIITPRKWKNW